MTPGDEKGKVTVGAPDPEQPATQATLLAALLWPKPVRVTITLLTPVTVVGVNEMVAVLVEFAIVSERVTDKLAKLGVISTRLSVAVRQKSA